MAKKNVKLSVAIAVFNEENNLEECLSSVAAFADEIIVVDGGSSDATVSIAKKFTSHIIHTDNPAMFHINKQKALDACSGDWILQLDADERVTSSLKNEITNVINSGKSDINGYFIPRRNYFWGHFMRKGGQYPDYVVRLVKRGKARFPCKSVHEQIEVDGRVDYLQCPILHYSYRTRADYWKKAKIYTTLTARTLVEQHVYAKPLQFFTYVVLKPISTFLSLYIRHKGFFDGLTGFEFSFYSALHFPIAYMRGISIQHST